MATAESSASDEIISQPTPTATTQLIIKDDEAASEHKTTRQQFKSIVDWTLPESKPCIVEMMSVVNAAAGDDDEDDEVIEEYKAVLEELQCTEACVGEDLKKI